MDDLRKVLSDEYPHTFQHREGGDAHSFLNWLIGCLRKFYNKEKTDNIYW